MCKSSNKIEEITVNVTIYDPRKIGDSFNDFSTRIGNDISESILPTVGKPDDFMPIIENLTDIDLGETNLIHFCDIIKTLQSKCSLDSDGISTGLLKKIAPEIS